MTKEPDIEIRGLAEYHTRLIGEMARQFYTAQDTPGENLIDRQQQRWGFLVQLVEDCAREAYFRGATHGLSLASATKYMIVTAEEKEAFLARMGEGSDA